MPLNRQALAFTALKIAGVIVGLAFAFAIGAGLVPLALIVLMLWKALTGQY